MTEDVRQALEVGASGEPPGVGGLEGFGQRGEEILSRDRYGGPGGCRRWRLRW